jgi:hypothetical protein
MKATTNLEERKVIRKNPNRQKERNQGENLEINLITRKVIIYLIIRLRIYFGMHFLK